MIGNQSLQIFFKTFEKYPLDQVGLNVYALADAAQKILKSFRALKAKMPLDRSRWRKG